MRFQISQQTRIQQEIYKHLLKSSKDLQKTPFPSKYEHQTFSQNGEDGIIQEIFSRIGTERGTFLEIGAGDGNENNTRLLLELGWQGTWIEGNKSACESAREKFSRFTDSGSLKIINAEVSPANINQLLKKESVPTEVDLFSLDIDMHTHHVWNEINYLEVACSIIEYNGFFPKEALWTTEYQKGQVWDGSIYMGASLKAIDKIALRKKMKLIGCDSTGTNAFFANEQITKDYFPETNIQNSIFEPARPFLVNDPEHKR